MTRRSMKRAAIVLVSVAVLVIVERFVREVCARDAIANALLAGGRRIPPVRALALVGGLLAARLGLFLGAPVLVGVLIARVWGKRFDLLLRK